ncbi:DUF6675 family protein [Breznakiellaceae bacterium SP9]
MKKVTKRLTLAFVCLLAAFPLSGQSTGLQTFGELVPFVSAAQKQQVFSSTGLIITNEKSQFLELTPNLAFIGDITGPVYKIKPSFLVEALVVVPYASKAAAGQSLTEQKLKIYNALLKVRDLKGRTYHSHSQNKYVALFEDATRIESAKQNTAVVDPPPARSIPASESIFMRLKDNNFGNCYYRATITQKGSGLLYNLTNFEALSYYFFTVMSVEKFQLQFYFEPLAEGVLIYCVAGADVSSFVASKIDMPSAVEKRMEVILGWMIDGIK